MLSYQFVIIFSKKNEKSEIFSTKIADITWNFCKINLFFLICCQRLKSQQKSGSKHAHQKKSHTSYPYIYTYIDRQIDRQIDRCNSKHQIFKILKSFLQFCIFSQKIQILKILVCWAKARLFHDTPLFWEFFFYFRHPFPDSVNLGYLKPYIIL